MNKSDYELLSFIVDFYDEYSQRDLPDNVFDLYSDIIQRRLTTSKAQVERVCHKCGSLRPGSDSTILISNWNHVLEKCRRNELIKRANRAIADSEWFISYMSGLKPEKFWDIFYEYNRDKLVNDLNSTFTMYKKFIRHIMYYE